MTDVLERARDWIGGDPNAGDRAELATLVNRAKAGEGAAIADLAERFIGPLEFGTAGLRGLIGAGETRMNEAVVVRATFGLVTTLLATVPNAAERGLLIGRDARRRSDELALAAAEVAAALGMSVYFLDQPVPTPVVAFGVPHLRAAAGIVITASHNPPEYNGYKVFWAEGGQIVPPLDQEIARAIATAPPANHIERRPPSAAAGFNSRAIENAYLEAIGSLCLPRTRLPRAPIRIAYTPLHGVGGRFFRAAFEAAGFVDLHQVASQAQPDGAFPTVRFPNPEEPEALAAVLALGTRVQADLVLANDPDADRLAVAVRGPGGRWITLGGNDIGVLLAHHVLVREQAPDDDRRLVITTVVSSQLLRQIAKALGVRYAETLTGFKWIADRALTEERDHGARFVFGYEEALGYSVHTVARDKDGIGAALVFAELAAHLSAKGESVHDRLLSLRRQYGLFVSRQKSLVLPGRAGAERIQSVMARLRAEGLGALGDLQLKSAWDLQARAVQTSAGPCAMTDLPPADVLIFELADRSRVCVRPSGTEPKMKLYLEVVESLGPRETLESSMGRAGSRLDSLLSAILGHLGLAEPS